MSDASKGSVGIGLIGLGTIGAGVVKVLKQKGRLPRRGHPKPQPGLFDAKQGLTSEVNKGAL